MRLLRLIAWQRDSMRSVPFTFTSGRWSSRLLSRLIDILIYHGIRIMFIQWHLLCHIVFRRPSESKDRAEKARCWGWRRARRRRLFCLRIIFAGLLAPFHWLHHHILITRWKLFTFVIPASNTAPLRFVSAARSTNNLRTHLHYWLVAIFECGKQCERRSRSRRMKHLFFLHIIKTTYAAATIPLRTITIYSWQFLFHWSTRNTWHRRKWSCRWRCRWGLLIVEFS